MFAFNTRLCTIVLPPSLPQIVRKFNPEEFRTEQRFWAKWKLKRDYPHERIKSSREIAAEQALYFTEHLIRTPECDKKQAVKGGLLVKNAPNGSDSLTQSESEPDRDKNRRNALIRMSNICANHTSSTYNYQNVFDCQKMA